MPVNVDSVGWFLCLYIIISSQCRVVILNGDIKMKDITFEMLKNVAAGVWAGPNGDGCIPNPKPKPIKIPQLDGGESL
jgi:hypothetical protein